MQKGFLSQYFEKVAIKRLTAVEVNTAISNQHELNGSKSLKTLFGNERVSYQSKFLWLAGESEGISCEGHLTWYDAREAHPTRSEYRLYFKSNEIMDQARESDMLIIAKRQNGEFYIIIVPYGSTLENQLLWLFGIEQVGYSFNLQAIENGHNPEVNFAVRYILEELDIEIEETDSGYLDEILEPFFSTGFPNTSVFSQLARQTMREVSSRDEPDETLLKWIEHEEKLFKRLEHHIVSQRLQAGFCTDGDTDVEGFIKFSLSVQNRRKSRIGYALEHHLEEIFKVHELRYSRTAVTENKSKPDFLFPDIKSYKDMTYPESRLTMLGVKSTCKDRWRQVLSEANRINKKHLFTLEPGISENQTDEMQAKHLQLVLPKRLHETYKSTQQSWLMDLKTFIQLANKRQKLMF
ncbi:type II restriction endonuclease [Marinicrinis sediminis]|uniref:Type II restriction endonuclease n=1 Tax=Marinicrinis sediminis TaxID=1652465 RepID=A0ABW5R577_9BACL